jgi:hypothetical protein
MIIVGVDLNHRSPGYEPGGMDLATLPRFQKHNARRLFKREYRDGCFFECFTSTRPAMKRMAEQSFSKGVLPMGSKFQPYGVRPRGVQERLRPI